MLVVAYATGRASHARQVKGDDPDKKGPPGWGLGVRLTTPLHKKKYCYKTSRRGQGPFRAVELLLLLMMMMMMMYVNLTYAS
jgi:hypothetical protein